ncbi:MAG: metallophosphoesterase [Lachnospiraceae bacterium]|nr:metallophosphoesterase [Lachnospiraceae bacterium]
MGFRLGRFLITRYKVFSPKIKEPLSLCVLADLHECTFGKGNCRLLDTVTKLKPDIVVIAGDLINAEPGGNAEETMAFLRRLSRRFPVFFAPGNHEHKVYKKKYFLSQMERLNLGLRKAGVKLFRNESRIIPEAGVKLSGLDLDRIYYRKLVRRRIPPGLILKLLGHPDAERFHILVAHNPEHFDAYSRYGCDLVLSGHVHGGIIRLPFLGGVISPTLTLFPKYDGGIYLKGRTGMIVSRGLGSHTINIRINNPPELLMLYLRPSENREGTTKILPEKRTRRLLRNRKKHASGNKT